MNPVCCTPVFTSASENAFNLLHQFVFCWISWQGDNFISDIVLDRFLSLELYRNELVDRHELYVLQMTTTSTYICFNCRTWPVPPLPTPSECEQHVQNKNCYRVCTMGYFDYTKNIVQSFLIIQFHGY